MSHLQMTRTQEKDSAMHFKPAPACNFVQTPCQAALKLVREHRVLPADISTVEVRVAQAACGVSRLRLCRPDVVELAGQDQHSVQRRVRVRARPSRRAKLPDVGRQAYCGARTSRDGRCRSDFLAGLPRTSRRDHPRPAEGRRHEECKPR